MRSWIPLARPNLIQLPCWKMSFTHSVLGQAWNTGSLAYDCEHNLAVSIFTLPLQGLYTKAPTQVSFWPCFGISQWDSIHIRKSCLELNQAMHVKVLEQCLTHSKYSVNASGCYLGYCENYFMGMNYLESPTLHMSTSYHWYEQLSLTMPNIVQVIF